mmetsp:Transcript_13446/g.35762  ORF Transcript_13446/g.35762 Transcript_13446/m.35762 type:complete len:99 (+) Transcript_13446:278-574(+)
MDDRRRERGTRLENSTYQPYIGSPAPWPPRRVGVDVVRADTELVFTHAEREEKCVSVQEHVWGTDGLAKLEAIKAKIDPQGLFQCQKCVGFKGPVRDY